MTAAPATVLTERARRAVASSAATAAASHPVARVSAAHPGPLPGSNDERRRTEIAPRTSQHAESPRIHDLCVPSDDGSPPAIYRVYEVMPSNFEATCRALHGRDWLTERIAPIVLVHGRLSSAQAARLPPHVPWLSVCGSVADTLDVLCDALVAPLREKGWICVDFMDYAAALGLGGELVFCRANHDSAKEAKAKLIERFESKLHGAGGSAALCLHAKLPQHGTMGDVDALGDVFSFLSPQGDSADGIATLSAIPEHRQDFMLTLISVSARSG